MGYRVHHMQPLTISRVEWLECRDCDRHGLSSKPTRAILLRSWKRHLTALYPALRSSQAVRNFSHILSKQKTKIKNFKPTAIPWHLRKQVGVIACPTYKQLRRFPNTEIKTNIFIYI